MRRVINLKDYIHFRKNHYQPIDFPKPQKKRLQTSQKSSIKDILSHVKESFPENSKSTKYIRYKTCENEGKWSNLLKKTSESNIYKNRSRQCNPRVLSSSVFTLYSKNQKEKRHLKSTKYSNHSFTTQIYSLPGGLKREDSLIKDDNYKCKRNNIAFITKQIQDFSLYSLYKYNNNKSNNNLYLGNYGNPNKNKSSVLFGNNSKTIEEHKPIKTKNNLIHIFGKTSNEIHQEFRFPGKKHFYNKSVVPKRINEI